MKIKTVSAEELSRPSAPFSHEVVAGDFVFVAGQATRNNLSYKSMGSYWSVAGQATHNNLSYATSLETLLCSCWLPDQQVFFNLLKNIA